MKKRKKAFITGITGQDGSYLAELLLSKGYEVHGTYRWDSVFTTERIEHIYQDPHEPNVRLFTYYCDLSDTATIERLIREIKPDEVYHLAAQSHVRVSFDMPEYVCDVNALGTLRVLEAIRKYCPKCKFYMAASSEMFGASPPPQDETTPFNPRSPYACSKIFGFYLTKFYREAYGLFAANGILFNHESPRRGPTFVTRKITRGIARIVAGLDKKIYLGNLKAKRDWGFAPEYVEGMYKILHYKKPDDFVLATGETHSVEEFVREAFKYAGLGDWRKYVAINSYYFRPGEVDILIGNSKKAKKILGWKPKIKFKDLVKIMIDAEFRRYGLKPPGEGDKILRKKFPNKWWKRD